MASHIGTQAVVQIGRIYFVEARNDGTVSNKARNKARLRYHETEWPAHLLSLYSQYPAAATAVFTVWL
jgi:hypothetical protein